MQSFKNLRIFSSVMQKAKCFVMRHKQSLANLHGDAGKDCELSDYGKIQSKQVCGEWDLVIVSCLKRAQQTLTCSNLSYKQKLVTPFCREIMMRDSCDYLEYEQKHLWKMKMI